LMHACATMLVRSTPAVRCPKCHSGLVVKEQVEHHACLRCQHTWGTAKMLQQYKAPKKS